MSRDTFAVKTIRVEVAAAMPERQLIVELVVAEGTTAWEAVLESKVQDHLPGLVVDRQALGIFGKRCSSDRELVDGDRVEVYRPLTADPKEIRRALARLESGN